MTNENRLTNIEQRQAVAEGHVVAIRDAVQRIEALLTDNQARIQATERAQLKQEIGTKAELKLLRIGVGLSLMVALGGGGAIVTKILGI